MQFQRQSLWFARVSHGERNEWFTLFHRFLAKLNLPPPPSHPHPREPQWVGPLA